jgi:hypothetical protein
MKFFTYKTCESQHFIAKTREIQYLWTLQWKWGRCETWMDAIVMVVSCCARHSERVTRRYYIVLDRLGYCSSDSDR